MPRFQKGPSYMIQYRAPLPDICLPDGFDLTDYVEISVTGAAWATFLNLGTLETISCKDFYDKVQEEMHRMNKEE